jgi:hypothetical protein
LSRRINKGVFKIQIYHKYIRGGPDLPGKGQKCYFPNGKVRKRKNIIRQVFYMIRRAGRVICALCFMITGLSIALFRNTMYLVDPIG